MTRPIATLALIASLSATPALAQETDQSFEEGFSLLGEGMALIMRALESEMAPMLEALGEVIDDVNAFDLPEVLENGDIIIRRKTPLPEGDTDGEAGVTDL